MRVTSNPDRVFNREVKEDKQFLRDLVVHAGDLANPVLAFPMYRRWAELIFEEMYQQSTLERQLGLPSALKIEKQVWWQIPRFVSACVCA